MKTLGYVGGTLVTLACAAFNITIITMYTRAVIDDRRTRRADQAHQDMAAANEADDLELWARQMGQV